MSASIAVVDYGHGNLGSILNMLKKIGSPGILVSDPERLDCADKIILPGVGAFDSGMQALEQRGFRETLVKKALVEKVPLLGICLGMQMLGGTSEEGVEKGLGVISGRCRRFPQSTDMRLKVPHMGWTEVVPSENALLFNEVMIPPRFYFVHSYYFECDNDSDVAASAEYGVKYAAAVQNGNIFGVQFHPEKSHRFGMHLLRNFVGL
jgi:glutamine amidotransferase